MARDTPKERGKCKFTTLKIIGRLNLVSERRSNGTGQTFPSERSLDSTLIDIDSPGTIVTSLAYVFYACDVSIGPCRLWERFPWKKGWPVCNTE